MSARRSGMPPRGVILVILATTACRRPASEATGTQEGPGNGVATGSTKVPKPVVGAPPIRPELLTPGEEPKLPSMMVSGVPLPPDPSVGDGDPWGIDLSLSVTLRVDTSIPLHFGAIPAANLAARAAGSSTWRVTLADGRARIRFAGRSPGLVEESELRGARGLVGFLVMETSSPHQYRVVPAGALRTFLNEHRTDVAPFAATRLASLESRSRLGRSVDRVSVTTAYGTLELEQMTAPVQKPSRSSSLNDGATESRGLEGAGEPLCRALLELIVADRAVAGPPCDHDRVPVFAEVTFAAGGGLTLEATGVREGIVTRTDIALPPLGATLATRVREEPERVLDDATLLSLRARGEPAGLEIENRTPVVRVALIDGVPAAWVRGGGARTIPLRAGRYLLEWRTALGEIVEPPTEVTVPGRRSIPRPLPSGQPSTQPPAAP